MSSKAIQKLLDRQAVEDAVNELFLATDLKDWERVKAIFADAVHFDMTSLAGGEPASLTPDDIASSWEDGLADVEQVHHQTSNFVVSVAGDTARASCYGTATHVRSKSSLTTFIGSYDFGLKRGASGWKIDSFQFNKKFVG